MQRLPDVTNKLPESMKSFRGIDLINTLYHATKSHNPFGVLKNNVEVGTTLTILIPVK